MNVNDLLAKVVDTLKTTVGQTSHVVKENVEYLLQKPTVSLEDLAAFVATHPDVTYKTKKLLDLRFNFYELVIHDLSFHLETKGESGEHILELYVAAPHQKVFEYHSFKNRQPTDKPIRLPNTLNQIVH
ncbi:hypothetical protein PY093_09110 [Cytobacillus sp. S13-E01]|uniref:hypothetical protein n=1 Tax=Cytobacillus sp. S13-E01 TaxID=3031326 RepID=UPI0023D87384|nr:hypothetical protein [Cytobacillus sp. S13-E01]MDF0726873.1 hypothetical protein [Cytobacillus sp. S13-E01]